MVTLFLFLIRLLCSVVSINNHYLLFSCFEDDLIRFFMVLLLTVHLFWSLVERVRSQWDSTQHGIEARLQQLDNMIGHSNKWEELRKEVKAFIGHNEGRLHNLVQQSKDPLTKQLADINVWEISMSSEPLIPSYIR